MKKKYHIDVFDCPDCSNIFKVKRRIFFDARHEKWKRKDIQSGEMFKVTCPKCKTYFYVRDFVYEDKRKTKTVFLNKKENLKIIYSRLGFDLNNYYGVDEIVDLNNCIYCIENDLNWWIIKLYIASEKYWYLQDCKENGLDNPIFERETMLKVDGENQLYLSLKNYDNCRRVIISMDLYKKLIKLCKDKVYKHLVINFLLSEDNAIEILKEVGWFDGN